MKYVPGARAKASPGSAQAPKLEGTNNMRYLTWRHYLQLKTGVEAKGKPVYASTGFGANGQPCTEGQIKGAGGNRQKS